MSSTAGSIGKKSKFDGKVFREPNSQIILLVRTDLP
jgi:hypothetical protein